MWFTSAHLVPLVSGFTKVTAKSVHEPFPVLSYFFKGFFFTIFFNVLIEFVTILLLFYVFDFSVCEAFGILTP